MHLSSERSASRNPAHAERVSITTRSSEAATVNDAVTAPLARTNRVSAARTRRRMTEKKSRTIGEWPIIGSFPTLKPNPLFQSMGLVVLTQVDHDGGEIDGRFQGVRVTVA